MADGFRPGLARLGAADAGITVNARFIRSRNPGRPVSSGSSEWPGPPGHSLLERVRISGAVGAKAVSAAFVTYRVAQRGHSQRVDVPATVDVPAQPPRAYVSRGSASSMGARFPGGQAAGGFPQEACQFYWRDSCGGYGRNAAAVPPPVAAAGAGGYRAGGKGYQCC